MLIDEGAMSRFVRPAVALAALALVIFAARTLGLHESVTVDGMRRLTEPYGVLAPAAFVVVCVLTLLLHMPGGMVIAIGALLFGAVRGFVYGFVGIIVGTTLIFLLVRYVARDAIATRLGLRFKRFRDLDTRLASEGFRVVVLLRLVLFLAPPLNYAIGATSVRFRSHLAGTAIGVLPGLAGTVYLADAIANAQSLRDLLAPEFIVPALLMLSVVASAAWFGRGLLRGAAPR
jgi:uncharacterized membrane protein YdjX (TVP38/TMEM64 family)